MFRSKVKLTDDEQALIVRLLIDFKNELIRQGRYTDAVDDLLLKILR